ncbi:MAG: hypothetical protein RSC93_03905 [Erysipelotrichaceae bacterium]
MYKNNQGFLLIESLLFLLCSSILVLMITMSLQLLKQSQGKEIDIQKKWEKEIYELYKE